MKTDAELEAMFPIVARRHPMGSEKIVRFAVFLAGYSEEKMMLSEWTTHDEARHFQSVCMTAFRTGWNACREEELGSGKHYSALASDKLSKAVSAAMSGPKPSSADPPPHAGAKP